MRSRQESSFSEEKEAKRLFSDGLRPRPTPDARLAKVFWFFFSKKNALPSFLDGTIALVSESRFHLTDDAGVSHLFLLGHACLAEPAQLPALLHRRVRVRHRAAHGLLARVATDILLPD